LGNLKAHYYNSIQYSHYSKSRVNNAHQNILIHHIDHYYHHHVYDDVFYDDMIYYYLIDIYSIGIHPKLSKRLNHNKHPHTNFYKVYEYLLVKEI